MTTKKQHYVPQFLLRYFSYNNNDGIYVFDKKELAIRRQQIRDIAHENYFYNYQDDDGSSKSLEQELSRMESDSAVIISNIIANQSLDILTEDEQWILSFFTASQILRTRRQRLYRSRSFDTFLEALKDNQFTNSWISKLSEKEEKDYDAVNEHIQYMWFNTPIFAHRLSEKQLFLLRSPYQNHFITSDHPTVVWNYHWKDDSCRLEVIEKGSEIYFPITPSLAILFADKDYNTAAMGRIIFPTDTSTTFTIWPNAIEFINNLQVPYSERFLFASHSEFQFAKELIKHNPEWQNGPSDSVEDATHNLQFLLDLHQNSSQEQGSE